MIVANIINNHYAPYTLLMLYPQICRGPKRRRQVIDGEPADKNLNHDSEQNVEEEKRIAPGCYVAMRLQKYCNEIPQIGRVFTIDGECLTIQWWEGTYSGTWKEYKSKGEVLTEEVNKDAVLKEVQLSKSSRLSKEQIEDLTSLYNSVDLV